MSENVFISLSHLTESVGDYCFSLTNIFLSSSFLLTNSVLWPHGGPFDQLGPGVKLVHLISFPGTVHTE